MTNPVSNMDSTKLELLEALRDILFYVSILPSRYETEDIRSYVHGLIYNTFRKEAESEHLFINEWGNYYIDWITTRGELTSIAKKALQQHLDEKRGKSDDY